MCSECDDLNVNGIDVSVRINVGRVRCSDQSIPIGGIADGSIGDHSECTGLNIELIEITCSIENGSFGEETDGSFGEVCIDGIEQSELNIGFIIRNNTNDAGMCCDGSVVVHDDAIASRAIHGAVGGDDLDRAFIGGRCSIGSEISVDANIVVCENSDVPSSGCCAVDSDDVGIDDDITGCSASFDENVCCSVR